MSRIGKQPVDIPDGVEVKLMDNYMKVKGPKGELDCNFPEGARVSIEGNKILVDRPDNSKKMRAVHGLARILIANTVQGVTNGYQKALELTGIGYRVQVQGSKLVFSLGYSHPVEFMLPEGITASVDQKQTQITLAGIDKQKLGQIAANIRSLRPPDAYKGKGIRYAGERLKLKVGKAGKK